MIKIKISKDYSETPGARYKTDGPDNGEEFRIKFLEPYFNDKDNNEILLIDLDDTEGYGTSFLDESFGGLARKYGVDKVLKRLQFISLQDPTLIEEIHGYIKK